MILHFFVCKSLCCAYSAWQPNFIFSVTFFVIFKWHCTEIFPAYTTVTLWKVLHKSKFALFGNDYRCGQLYMYTQGSSVEIRNPAYWSLNSPPLVLWPCSIFPPSLSHFSFIPGRKLWPMLNNIISFEFQPVYHTIYTSPTACSNQYATQSTHHLHAIL